jgi:phosphoribosylformylglycinamidine cyclo-ligase
MSEVRLTYKEAGVDRQASATLLDAVGRTIRSTFTTRVLGDLGHFSGLFHLRGYTDPVLVSTIDGVGTKVLLAAEAGRLDFAGRDVVSHGVNDVVVLGATPLLMLDYVAAARLEPAAAAQVLDGITAACREEGVALIGGEMAQMPGIYTAQGIDVAACMIGAVERSAIIDGSSIKPGHVLIGMVAAGLHTNGYALARAVLAHRGWSLADSVPELGTTWREMLLRPHLSYRRPILALAAAGHLRGAAHITGGGIPGNLVRILPDGCRARVKTGAWHIPAIFTVLERAGKIPRDEMYSTFNMGVGMIAVVPGSRAGVALDLSAANGADAWVIGEIVAGEKGVELLA